MPNFENTIDSRWRPDLESSQRRVRQEDAEPAVTSRELALIPPGYKKPFEAHDRQTAALIRRMAALERLPHGEAVSRLIGEWDWIEKMMGYEEKQRFLEPLIIAAQREPAANEHLLIFLMLVFEPVRRTVSKAFVDARSGLDGCLKDVNWGNRAEARMIQHVERQQLFDVTREAALEALFKFPTPAPKRLFPWLRETIAYRALDKLRGDLPELATSSHSAAEAEAIQEVLAGFERLKEPVRSDRSGMRAWRAGPHARRLRRGRGLLPERRRQGGLSGGRRAAPTAPARGDHRLLLRGGCSARPGRAPWGQREHHLQPQSSSREIAPRRRRLLLGPD